MEKKADSVLVPSLKLGGVQYQDVRIVRGDQRFAIYPRDTKQPQCIICSADGKVLCKYPKKPIIYRAGMKVDTTKYRIYYMSDGTIINMYYWRNKWRIATSRGFDVTDFPMTPLGATAEAAAVEKKEPVTYEQIVMKLFADVGASFNDLDTAHSYTFGFTWHTAHPFAKNFDRVWFVSSWNSQTDVFEDAAPKQIMPQTPVGDLSIVQMTIANTKALVNFLAGKDPLFGFILRHVGSGQDLQMDSYLMRQIRKMFYDKSVGMTREELALRSFLFDPSVAGKLFPCFADKFAQWDAICKHVAIAKCAGKEVAMNMLTPTELKLYEILRIPATSSSDRAYEFIVSPVNFVSVKPILEPQ